MKNEEMNELELEALLKQAETLQKQSQEEEGVQATYLLLAKSGSKALKKSEKDLYIQDLKVGDIYIQKTKKNLGDTVRVVPLAFISLYNEKDGTGKDAKFYGTWSKQDALQFPPCDGVAFNRQLPNGHILVPVNWVCVYLPDFPEIENAVVAFKSTGIRIWRDWRKDAQENSTACATLVYNLCEEVYGNDDYDWTDFSFKLEGSLLESDKLTALKTLKKSNEIQEAVQSNTFAPKHTVTSAEVKAIESKANPKALATQVIQDASDEDLDIF